MQNETDLKRYSASELQAMVAAGDTSTDWARVDAKTAAELEADIASDPEWADVPADWFETAVPVVPATGGARTIRLDREVVEWFLAQGPGYEERINAALRAYRVQALKAATP